MSISSTTTHTSLSAKQPSPWPALIGFLILCCAVAAAGALITAPSIPTWYAALAKPAFNPPNWLFDPVWIILYTLMAIAAWRIWSLPKTGPVACYRRKALLLFGIQLTLNFLWAPAFFYAHQILIALIINVLLAIAILITTLRFWRIDRIAGALMLPYLAWVVFAATLNYALFHLN
jgi:benzodiazapine receptor